MSSILHQELTRSIIKIFFDVYNELGYGFLERVYQNALYFELKANGFHVETQKKIKVYYKEIEVGDYYADIIVNDLVIWELKAQEYIVEAREKFSENGEIIFKDIIEKKLKDGVITTRPDNNNVNIPSSKYNNTQQHTGR